MIGLPPLAPGLTGRPADIAEHASQVAREWEDVAESYVRKRMRELGIPEGQIGAGLRPGRCACARSCPMRWLAGPTVQGGDYSWTAACSNPTLNARDNGPEATKVWAKSRLRDRIDSVVAHEHLEGQGVSHDEVCGAGRGHAAADHGELAE